MRFVWAVVSFVIAAVLVAAGFAQRTIFLGDTTQHEAVSVSEDAPYTLIDGRVLTKLPGAQTLKVDGSGAVFVGYARTDDAKAWLADTAYNQVTLRGDGTLKVTNVAAKTERPEPTEADTKIAKAAADAKVTVPSAATPVGSDIWLAEFADTDSVVKQLRLPADISLVVASDGTKPAPAKIDLSWPVDNATPWAGPLVVLGSIALVIGLLFWVLGIRHMRRSRGPRRRGLPPLPDTKAIEIGAPDAADADGVISSTPDTKPDARSGRRRAFLALPALALAAVTMAGCSPDIWPKLGGATPTPSPTSTVVVPDDQQKPVLTEAQARTVFDRIAATVDAADTAKSADLASARLSGAALEERATNYTLRAKMDKEPALAALPTAPYQIILPEARNNWPRTVMAVWSNEKDKKDPPRIMVASQEDPWSPYRLSYIGQMEASAQVPDLAPATIGANLVRPDSTLLAMAPDQLATAYADILDKGDKSEFAGIFDVANDSFRKKVIEGRNARLQKFNQTGAKTGNLTFSSKAGDHAPIALSTVKSGAIVAISVTEIDTVKATNADAVIKLDNNKRAAVLSGKEQSPKGFETSYGDQLFFFVPGQGEEGKIKMLGYSSNILSAKELK